MRQHDSAITAPAASLPAVALPDGLLLGLTGVAAFSLSLPATRAALPAFGPLTVGVGRSAVAALIAGACLLVARRRGTLSVPTRPQVRRLGLVVLGVVFGFPLLSTAALDVVGAAHGAVVIGLLPIGTALCAVVRAGERPRPAFWLAGAAGAVAVLVFAATTGAGIGIADLLLLGAVAAGAIGYAEGGALARELPGWQVIAWALVLALPGTLPLTVAGLVVHPPVHPGAGAWTGLAYLAAVSSFLGFVAWYRALAAGGVARIGQLQLAQPVLTLGWSAWLLSERVTAAMVLAAAGVLICTATTQRVKQTSPVRTLAARDDARTPSGGVVVVAGTTAVPASPPPCRADARIAARIHRTTQERSS